MPERQTYYEVLDLCPDGSLQPEYVKQAYHRALLVHHPDKARQVHARESRSTDHESHNKPTIDQIVSAYTVLSDPLQRKSYDAALKTSTTQTLPHRGIQSFDLDDLSYTEEDGHGVWSHSCRCDSGEGYIVTDQDLEAADSDQKSSGDIVNEVLVGCRGCSLFIRVTFATAAD